MADEVLNEAERFLVQHWAEARELEDSIGEVRIKYQSLCEKVAEVVRERYGDLDEMVEVTRTTGSGSLKTGIIVFGKDSWPRKSRAWTGYWIENLRLDYLADQDEPPPLAYLWINYEEADVGEKDANKAVLAAAREILTPQELAQIKTLADDDYMLGIEFAGKQDLIDMLSSGDAARFVATLAAPFNLLAKFTPTLDTLFTKSSE